MTCGIHLVPAIKDCGIANTLVATLKHESPYCMAGAAAALCLLGSIPDGGGQALLVASGAIPALVRVIERRPPCNHRQETGLYRRCAPSLCSYVYANLHMSVTLHEVFERHT